VVIGIVCTGSYKSNYHTIGKLECNRKMVPGDKVEVIISKVLRWQRFA
jgi:hypothetical protein